MIAKLRPSSSPDARLHSPSFRTGGVKHISEALRVAMYRLNLKILANPNSSEEAKNEARQALRECELTDEVLAYQTHLFKQASLSEILPLGQ